MNDKIQEDLRPLYKCYAQYKMLFDYYQDNKSMRSKKEIEDRLEYLRKNKCKERTEIEVLLWLLDTEENNVNN